MQKIEDRDCDIARCGMKSTLMPTGQRLTVVTWVVSVAIMMVSSIAFGEIAKKLPQGVGSKNSAVLDLSIVQEELTYSSVVGKSKTQLSLEDGQDFKEYLAQCRSLIRGDTAEQRARGEECYKNKLQTLIEISESYPGKWNPDVKN